MNDTVSYTYDPVGNRTQKVSTLPGFPGGLSNYNANDQLSTDTYDSDGNTAASNGVGYGYDFENLSLSKMLSGVSVFEISDIQEDEPEAPVSGWSQCNDVTLRRKQLNGGFAYHT